MISTLGRIIVIARNTLTEAVRQKVTFLGEVPIFKEIREGGDQGVPVVVSAPDGPAGGVFAQMAASLRKELG